MVPNFSADLHSSLRLTTQHDFGLPMNERTTLSTLMRSLVSRVFGCTGVALKFPRLKSCAVLLARELYAFCSLHGIGCN